MSNNKLQNEEVLLFKDSIFQAKNSQNDTLESGRRQTAPAEWQQKRKKIIGSLKSKTYLNDHINNKNIKIE